MGIPKWSKETIVSRANGYNEPVNYICDMCGANIDPKAMEKCPCCGEQIDIIIEDNKNPNG